MKKVIIVLSFLSIVLFLTACSTGEAFRIKRTAQNAPQIQVKQTCQPNTWICANTTSTKQCKPDGSGYYVNIQPCGTGTVCYNGACTLKKCEPNSWACEGLTAKIQCDTYGAGYNTPVYCNTGEVCSKGACLPQLPQPEQS